METAPLRKGSSVAVSQDSSILERERERERDSIRRVAPSEERVCGSKPPDSRRRIRTQESLELNDAAFLWRRHPARAVRERRRGPAPDSECRFFSSFSKSIVGSRCVQPSSSDDSIETSRRVLERESRGFLPRVLSWSEPFLKCCRKRPTLESFSKKKRVAEFSEHGARVAVHELARPGPPDTHTQYRFAYSKSATPVLLEYPIWTFGQFQRTRKGPCQYRKHDLHRHKASIETRLDQDSKHLAYQVLHIDIRWYAAPDSRSCSEAFATRRTAPSLTQEVSCPVPCVGTNERVRGFQTRLSRDESL